MPAKPSSISTKWVKSSHSLNSEREKAIYNMGKEKGAAELRKQFEDKINANFAKSYIDTSKVLEKLKQEKIDIISARLKMESIYCFKIMLSIKEPEKSILNLEDVYNFIYEIEEKENNEDYIVNFSIIKANKNFSDAKVESDGYIYKHRLFINEEETRTA